MGVRQWLVSRQHRLRRRWPRRNLICLFIVCESKVTIRESRTISHANDTKAQQVAPNPSSRKNFHRNSSGVRTPTSNSAWTTKEKTSTRNREAEGTSLSAAKATPKTRDRGTEDWNQRHFDRLLLKILSRLYMYIKVCNVSALYYGPNNNNFQANWYLFFVFVFFKSGRRNNAKSVNNKTT